MNWPLSPSAIYTDEGTNLVNSRGTTVTTGGVAHVKTAWVQLTAASTRRYSGFIFLDVSGFSGRFLWDIGVGGAGSEEVIVENLYVDGPSGFSAQAINVKIPVVIPEGSRIAVRCQSSGLNRQQYPGIIGESMDTIGDYGHSRYVAYGANLATTQGQAVDPGGVAGTKGAYTQIAAATNEDIAALYLHTGRDGNAAANPLWLVDIAIGGAGSEEVIVPNLHLATASTLPQFNWPPFYGPLPVTIPAGTRLAVRCQANNIVVGQREIDVTLGAIAA